MALILSKRRRARCCPVGMALLRVLLLLQRTSATPSSRVDLVVRARPVTVPSEACAWQFLRYGAREHHAGQDQVRVDASLDYVQSPSPLRRTGHGYQRLRQSRFDLPAGR
jgi:hypothetical protein